MKKNKRNVSDIILKKAEYSIEKGSTHSEFKFPPLKIPERYFLFFLIRYLFYPFIFLAFSIILI